MNSQKKIPLHTRLGNVTIEIHLSVYHRESSNNERWKQFLFELPESGQVVTKRKGSKLRRTTFQSQLDLKLEGVGLEDLQPDMSSDNLQWLLSQEKPLMGLTQKSC